jgi:RNA polymerase sigma-70 factor (ECF subfamily)
MTAWRTADGPIASRWGRLVFNLYGIEGYSHQEIGEMLNISVGTSKSNLSRARVILQEKVAELYKEKKQHVKLLVK